MKKLYGYLFDLKSFRHGTNRKGGSLLIANFLGGLLIVGLLSMVFGMFAPFTLVFVDDDAELCRQENVSFVTNYEKRGEKSGDCEMVYGEDPYRFKYSFGDETVEYKGNSWNIRFTLLCTAVANLYTFNWDKEEFVIKMVKV